MSFVWLDRWNTKIAWTWGGAPFSCRPRVVADRWAEVLSRDEELILFAVVCTKSKGITSMFQAISLLSVESWSCITILLFLSIKLVSIDETYIWIFIKTIMHVYFSCKSLTLHLNGYSDTMYVSVSYNVSWNFKMQFLNETERRRKHKLLILSTKLANFRYVLYTVPS